MLDNLWTLLASGGEEARAMLGCPFGNSFLQLWPRNAVLIVHGTASMTAQRGTTRPEDALDTVVPCAVRSISGGGSLRGFEVPSKARVFVGESTLPVSGGR